MSKTKNILKIIYMFFIIFSFLIANDKVSNNLQAVPFARFYPSMQISVLNNPEPGYIFVGNDKTDMGVMDNYGNSIDTAAFRKITMGFGLDLQKNGYLTYFEAVENKFYAIDSTYKLIDSFAVPSPYRTDLHDIIFNIDGSYLMIAEDRREYDMSKIVLDGDPKASVLGFVLLEFDKKKNLVWQWSTWDHFNIKDCTSDINLTANDIDFCHINSIEYDISDGNIIISNRHMDEITKIKKSTGEIMWRMGGDKCKNNQFTFVNDSYNGFTGFSHQHDAKILPNGNLLLFDNGNLKPSPQFSRAVEYKINEVSKTVTKVWEYSTPDKYYNNEMGNVQRLPFGNTLINFKKQIYEVDKNNKIVYNSTLVDDASTYRAFKFIINMAGVNKSVSKTGKYDFNETNNKTNVILDLVNVGNSGRLTVEKHNYKPNTMPFADFIPAKTLNYRWVISGEINNIGGKISVDTKDLIGFNTKDTFLIFIRDAENNGNFVKLNTIYVDATKTLEANFNKKCEFIIATNKPLPSSAPFLKFPLTESLFLGDSLLTWSPIIAADKYKLQISKISDFSTILIDTFLTQTRFNFNNYEFSNKYFWRVCAYSIEFDYFGPWSDIWAFRTFIKTPIPLLPLDNSTKVSAKSGKFKWSNVDYATNYSLEVAEDSTFKSNTFFANRSDLTDTSMVYQSLKPFTWYYWRVAAINGDGFTKWSNVMKFQTVISVPKLLSPENKSVGVDISGMLNYDKPSEADFFEYQISKFVDFSLIDYSGFTSRTQSTLYNKIQSFTKYFWRIRSIHQKDTSDWSEIFQFTTQISVPKLSYPLNFATNELQSISLKWIEINGVNSYDIYLSETSDFNQSKTFSNLSNKLPLTDSKPLQEYYWKVRAVYNGGNSNFSDVWKFKTGPAPSLNKPILLLPNTGTKNLAPNVILSWQAVNLAENYRYQVSKDSIFDIIVKDSVTSQTENLLINLDINTSYYWRVQAQSKNAISTWSNSNNFTIGNKEALNFPITLLPIDHQILNDTTVTFAWNSVKDALEYGIILADNIDFALNKNEFKNIKDTTFKTILYPNKKYFWKIYSINNDNKSLESPILSFEIKSLVNVINEIAKTSNYIYPNPVTDVLSICIDELTNCNKITICNLAGVNVKSISTNLLNPNKIDIDCSDLALGVYSLTIYIQSNSLTYYFVKN